VIFDLWGTLVPFRAALADQALAQIASGLGASLDEFVPAWRAGYGQRITGDLESSLRAVCRELGVAVDDAAVQSALQIRYAAHAAMFEPRPDAVPLLRRLRAEGYRTCLVTNCTSEVPRLWRDGPLAALFDAEVFSCTEGLRKPDPAIYALAASRLNTTAGSCMFVGDGADGELAGASAAGMHPILLRPGDTDPPARWTGPAISRLSDVVTHLPQ
jgi:putative hydrolase of the HAD superfamily